MSFPIDRNRLTEISGGDREFERELLEAYLEDALQCLQTIEQSMSAGDWGSVSAIAHQLKGSSGNVGAAIAADLCAQVEHHAKQQQKTSLSELQTALDEIASHISTDSPPI